MNAVMDILNEMRKDIPRVVDAKVILRNYADRIETAIKAYNKEITELLREFIGGVCWLCDSQTDCQKGEDGMPNSCNSVAKATHFINQHTEPESGKDLPF